MVGANKRDVTGYMWTNFHYVLAYKCFCTSLLMLVKVLYLNCNMHIVKLATV